MQRRCAAVGEFGKGVHVALNGGGDDSAEKKYKSV